MSDFSKEKSNNEMIKEMAEYGVTLNDIREMYIYDKNESDVAESFKNVSFNEYIKYYYMSDRYMYERKGE